MAAPDPNDVRIVTTLGHVDHGKTTLMDTLLASNKIISTRMAGKMRYLDSREDEQERGITMESSAVSLYFYVADQGQDSARKQQRQYTINFIDTPGHVDFSSEVSTASQLCDGALVLVDVVEGVCTQTIAVLRQSWLDGLRPILVINKIDRLVTELKLEPLEAYSHLCRLMEQVNAVMGSFFAGERMEDDLRWREQRERQQKADTDLDDGENDAALHESYQEKDDEDIYFAPQRGNVIFASAIDNWGFRIGKFAQIYAAKLGVKEANLRRFLWGDYYLDPKTKKVIGHKHLRGRALKPLFVQFVLENIWAIYDAVITNPNPEKVSKIVTALGLKIPSRDLKSKDTRALLTLIYSQWLPLSSCVAQTVIDVVPPPSVAQMTRLPKMLHSDGQSPLEVAEMRSFVTQIGSQSYILAYVSKMFAVPEKFFLENSKRRAAAAETKSNHRVADGTAKPEQSNDIIPAPPVSNFDQADSDGEVLLGFARLYSGTIRSGDRVSCVLPKYQNFVGADHPGNSLHVATATVESLYVMMGRELLPVDSVEAGNIFAIRGLEGKVWRSATICGSGEVMQDASSVPARLINLGRAKQSVPPIMRVALEPVMPADMPKLVKGLRLLSHSDPCVETFQQATGEHVIVTAGELHLERCLKDLRERFAKIEIQASKPIVPFRETAVKAADMPPPKTPGAARGTIRGSSSHEIVKFTIRASPLPKPISAFLLQNTQCLKRLLREGGIGVSGDEEDTVLDQEGFDPGCDIIQKPTTDPPQFWKALQDVCREVGGEWKDMTDRVMSFGPHMAGGCVLIDNRKGGAISNSCYNLRSRLTQSKAEQASWNNSDPLLAALIPHIETGFQLAAAHGPLCAEPMEGLAFFLESLEIDAEGLQKEMSQSLAGQVTGSLISSFRDACKTGLLDWSPRLMLAMYTCDIQASADVLGKVYGVVTKRRGRIVAEEMKEGTMLFSVRALLPVVESFGFADDIRTRTSGAASPQLIFSGYELYDQDPFWVPTTEEELEDLGEKSDRNNVAKIYMDGVRERKGMFVDRKLVENAEKQRTLKK